MTQQQILDRLAVIGRELAALADPKHWPGEPAKCYEHRPRAEACRGAYRQIRSGANALDTLRRLANFLPQTSASRAAVETLVNEIAAGEKQQYVGYARR